MPYCATPHQTYHYVHITLNIPQYTIPYWTISQYTIHTVQHYCIYSKISTHYPPILNFRVRNRIRFKIRIRVGVTVRVMAFFYLSIQCGITGGSFRIYILAESHLFLHPHPPINCRQFWQLKTKQMSHLE